MDRRFEPTIPDWETIQRTADYFHSYPRILKPLWRCPWPCLTEWRSPRSGNCDYGSVDRRREPSADVGRTHGSETSESAVAIKHRPRPYSATASSQVLPIVTLDPPIPRLPVMKLEPALGVGSFAACASSGPTPKEGPSSATFLGNLRRHCLDSRSRGRTLF